MAKHTGLYSRVYGWPDLLAAWRRARRGKLGRPSVASFELDAAGRLLELGEELRAKRYRPGPYDSFHVHDPKRRLLHALTALAAKRVWPIEISFGHRLSHRS